MMSVASVSPEIGLFDDPIMPTRLPDTAAKKKPAMSITMAANRAAADRAGEVVVEGHHEHERRRDAHEDDLEVEILLRCARSPRPRAADFFRSATPRRIPIARFFRILYSV